jgi:hypothetical protein
MERIVNIRHKRQRLVLGLTWGGLLFFAGTYLSAADDATIDRNNQFDIALVGDAPYAPSTGAAPNKVQTYPAAEYNAVIADINDHKKVLFTVHVGDIKAGDTWCVGGNSGKDPIGAANIFTNNRDLFNTYRNAAVFLPGDNEWTDCHRTNNGAYDPQERLAYLRNTFYPSNLSLGQSPITLIRQSSTPGFQLYKENVIWRVGDIIFVGINQPGSNNNSQRNIAASVPPPSDDNQGEYTARNAANIYWINKAFDMAAADSTTRAVMIFQQANPFERFLEPNQGYTRSGYEAFINTLRTRTVAFEKPVVLVGGDTHTVRIDKPLTTLYPGHTGSTGSAIHPATAGSRIKNFTRVEVFGSPDTHWVRAVVDKWDPNVFSFSTQTIAGNGHGRDGRDANDTDDLN